MHEASTEHSGFTEVDLKPALQLALALERAPMGLILLYDATSARLYPAVGEGLTAQQCRDFGVHRPGVGPIGAAFAKRRRVNSDLRVEGGVPLRLHAKALGATAMVTMPLGDDVHAHGVLALLYKGKRPSRERPHLPMFARFVSGVLDRAQQQHANGLGGGLDGEQATLSKTRFFARMSHELRTPLQSVLGYIDLLRDGIPEPLPRGHLELLEKASRSGEVLLSVIEDLITYSRAEDGHIEYRCARVSVDDAIAEAVSVVSPIAHARHVEVQAVHNAHEFVLADPAKLKQILINLLINAVKFSPSGGKVDVACGHKGRWVSLSVTDAGPGIEPDKQNAIFEPFVQVGTPLAGSLAGSGLGLPISREFAAAMGGEIQVQSAPGAGSKFTVKLRRRADVKPRRAAAERRSTQPPGMA